MAKLAASKSFPVKPNRSYTVTKYICRFSPSTAYRLGRLFSLLAVPYPRLLYNMLEPIMLAAGWIETSIRRPPNGMRDIQHAIALSHRKHTHGWLQVAWGTQLAFRYE
ncbi:hypothetical protein PMIN01_12854 [Paraphaeosphaeria minitans]|uniref:Uncharacterized protein n=1 Tax=Paraphaeosphaeria minitans TaxID=565426 RepID=A0A9P6G585_9PLEO|nr:hypothetical protein PMIN01_12854 [Paraphaeosphaeria minitans]